jgi:hypothetical protein
MNISSIQGHEIGEAGLNWADFKSERPTCSLSLSITVMNKLLTNTVKQDCAWFNVKHATAPKGKKNQDKR